MYNLTTPIVWVPDVILEENVNYDYCIGCSWSRLLSQPTDIMLSFEHLQLDAHGTNLF